MLANASYPARELELATFLSHHHQQVEHHLSASDCETTGVGELLGLADDEDRDHWATLRLGYTDPLGAPGLRAAAASGYETLSDADIVCFAGAQEALYAVLHGLLTPGDHAIVVLPGYQSVETLSAGLCAVTGVALDAARGWALDLNQVEAALRPNTRMIAISFPNNPTGKHIDPADYDALIALCRQRGIWLLSDEVYRLTERDPSRRLRQAADLYDRGISLGALSKAHGLPGLRIGWVACRDPWLMTRIATMRQYLSTCNAGPSEVLARIALKAGPQLVARNRAIAEANLHMLLAFLVRHDTLFDCFTPEGGVVCYPRYKGPDGVERFVERMAGAGILLLPASVFRSDLVALPTDRFRIGFGRLSFAAGLAALERALH